MEDQFTELFDDYATAVIEEKETEEQRLRILAFAAYLWLTRADETLDKNKDIAPVDFRTGSEMYHEYTQNMERLLDKYADRLHEKSKALAEAIAAEYPGLSFYDQQELLREALRSLPELERYQAERLARTELHNISQLADMDVVSQIVDVYGERVVAKKKWVAWSGACSICQSLDGTVLEISEPFLVEGQVIDLGDGRFYTHNYEDQLTATAHPNDLCSLEWIIEAY